MTATPIDVAIIGAGPYGLSLGAHLQGRGINYRVFGEPMHTWRTAMPKGMHLKSDGFATSLSDPKGELTLGRYCAEEGIPYADLGLPMVMIETFIDYGLAFQRRFVDNLDERWVKMLKRAPGGFLLQLGDDTEIEARRVVTAVGITYFASMPEEFLSLPPELCSHSSQHTDLGEFSGRRVGIVGGGSSALDIAALLHHIGADVEIIARRSEVSFHGLAQAPRPLKDRIHAPTSGIGPGWRSRFYTDAAPVFHRLPEEYRIATIRSTLGPAGGWFTRDVVGKVPISTSTNVVSIERNGDKVQLTLKGADGGARELICDHVIAATGYRCDLRRIEILESGLRTQIDSVEQTPRLSAHFESSVPGLYFIGPIAANSFGPMLRFAYGSRFVAYRLTRHLARTTKK